MLPLINGGAIYAGFSGNARAVAGAVYAVGSIYSTYTEKPHFIERAASSLAVDLGYDEDTAKIIGKNVNSTISYSLGAPGLKNLGDGSDDFGDFVDAAGFVHSLGVEINE
ncbi:hypothetical protein [Vibrio aestuarianus]|uniref:hypothetical protein n=1 Tax=Vibrio aestuarianus TaxID=28171 RepID=UPI00237C550B|nr:hypothetical protein [Vibrio aestuarianus]MDE1264055.1 hypothetical protein [Vibrio aestuarianus]MDE1296176.1 hypothetical protein [Vibrio aestuarianus]